MTNIWVSTIIEYVHGATLSIGNSENKNSSILAYNSGLEQDRKFKLSPLSFSQFKDYSCIHFMCILIRNSYYQYYVDYSAYWNYYGINIKLTHLTHITFITQLTVKS